jgi:kumamolisin
MGASLSLLGAMLFVTTQAGAASNTRQAPFVASSDTGTLSAPVSTPLGRAAVGGRTAADKPRHTTFLRPAAGHGRVQLTITFKPMNEQLLTQLADQASGKPGLPLAMLRHLVSPPQALVRETSAYLHRYGFRHSEGGILTQSYLGTVSAAEHAFHTPLGTYHAHGVVFRSAATTPTLPTAIATHVQTVSGLDTYPLNRPLLTKQTSHTAAQPHAAVTASCPGPGNVKSTFGGYLPADLASASGYDSQPLIDASHDGHGEVIDMLEFANYQPSDNAAYQSCFGLSVPISPVAVNGGTSDMHGALEVELDDQIAASAAPGLGHIYNYIAPNGTGFAAVIDQMLSDAAASHVTEISISWGACEQFQSFDDVAASDAEFKLAAAAGISVFSASGDDGASDCSFFGKTAPSVDFPASDPYVTAVGGTTLDTAASGANREVSWGTPDTGSGGGGGGGVSSLYPMPSWQTGTGVLETGYSSTLKCGNSGSYCREVPDVSLDANPDTGHIIYCTASADCGGAGWGLLGGTSAAAPLMAAITAEANHYSLANGGDRLGFANPFLYSKLGTAVFRDVTLGSNSILGGATYPAGTGYDMATGLGSPDASQLAQALASYTASSASIDNTSLTSVQSRNAITPGRSASLHGVLMDTTTGLPLAHRRITVQGFFVYNGRFQIVQALVSTANDGSFTATVSTGNVFSRMQWFAAFPGEEGINAALSPYRILRVLPTLTTTSSLRFRNGHYTVRHNTGFKLSGVSKPALRGRRVFIQYRVAGTRRWHATTIFATVGKSGAYSRGRLFFARPTRVYLRWHYAGSKSGPWLSATSSGKLFVIT